MKEKAMFYYVIHHFLFHNLYQRRKKERKTKTGMCYLRTKSYIRHLSQSLNFRKTIQ
jgi:hypothetical protein